MYCGLYVIYQLFSTHFNEIWILLVKILKIHIKFHENPFGSRVLFYAGGRMNKQTDRQIDMTKLRVAFRNFANAPQIVNTKPSKHSTAYFDAFWLNILIIRPTRQIDQLQTSSCCKCFPTTLAFIHWNTCNWRRKAQSFDNTVDLGHNKYLNWTELLIKIL